MEARNELLKANPGVIQKEFGDDIAFVLKEIAIVLVKIAKDTEISYDVAPKVLREIIENEDETFSITKDFSKRFKFAKSASKRRNLMEEMEHNIELCNEINKQDDLIKNHYLFKIGTDC